MEYTVIRVLYCFIMKVTGLYGRKVAFMKPEEDFMVSELSTLIHNLVLDNPVPAKDLAKAIGKPYSTLLREVNPYDTGAKLGAETLLQIMMQTGDTKPLEYMAGKLGYSLVAARNDAPHVTPGAFQGGLSRNEQRRFRRRRTAERRTGTQSLMRGCSLRGRRAGKCGRRQGGKLSSPFSCGTAKRQTAVRGKENARPGSAVGRRNPYFEAGWKKLSPGGR